ncbi:MAG: hypothetical protein KF745_10185 [Phycisphaeraceae bacterium]|nr:hypothetical protein [Phycisphaeraceae bacterium]
MRRLSLLTSLVVSASASIAGAAPDTYTVDFFPELPQNDGGVQLRFIGPARGTVVATRLIITYTTLGEFQAQDLVINLFARTPDSPLGGFLTVTGDDLGWSGQGTFSTTFTTHDIDGALTPGLWGFDLLGAGDPPSYSGQFSADTRFELDIEPDVCAADWDGNLSAEPADIAAFIQDWLFEVSEGAGLSTDINYSGTVDVVDIAVFIQRWLAAVSQGCGG